MSDEADEVIAEVTAGDAMTAIAKESPEAAGLLATIMEHNARQTELMYPSWEYFERAKADAYKYGYDVGYARARDEIHQRIFFDSWEPEG